MTILQIYDAPTGKTTLTATVHVQGSTAIALAATTLIELASPRVGDYAANVALPVGDYDIKFRDGALLLGTTALTVAPEPLTEASLAPLAKTVEVTAAKDAVLSRGDTAWITGNTVAPNNADIVLAKVASESVNAKVTTARAAALDNVATASAVAAIPTTPLLAANYTAPNNADIAAAKTAAERLTAARAEKLDGALAVSGDLAPLAKTVEVTAAKDAVLARGDTAWITGNTVAPDNAKIAATLIIAEVLRSLVNTAGTAYTSAALANVPSVGGIGGMTTAQAAQLLALYNLLEGDARLKATALVNVPSYKVKI
jgi:hypothetical protein